MSAPRDQLPCMACTRCKAGRQFARGGVETGGLARWIRGTTSALFAPMTLRVEVLASLLVVGFTTPVLAQPAQPNPPTDDLAAFDQDLQTLFVQGGLTSEQA